MKSLCVLGGSGAIGAAIVNKFSQEMRVEALNSQNCDLSDCHLDVSDFENFDIVVNAVGSFGGLKQYEQGEVSIERVFLTNLSKVIDILKPKILINISSAAVSNSDNLNESSPYFSYVKAKLDIEEIFHNKEIDSVISLRCTNIISRFENYQKSGHSIASIYRRFIECENNESIDIWSHPEDWREYIDADDLAILVENSFNLTGSHILTVGSGIKSNMENIIHLYKKKFSYIGAVNFTQPKKPGPVGRIVGVPEVLSRNNKIEMTSLEKSLDKCFDAWSQ